MRRIKVQYRTKKVVCNRVHTYLFTAPVWTTKRNFSSLSTTIWYWSLFRKCALPREKKNWGRFNDVNGFIGNKA